ncbi:DinB family protein [Bacillus dakarensis]|uniref:DinB family protein n=1 Tax=Robertmurraya dakarensis TaxID=1926278 RepID=UPI0009817FC5|nr:DinB family protein [Bacillus dakarensis]
METTIFKHYDTVRAITEQSISRIREDIVDLVPEGFNNSIRWNFGHIAFIQERLVFAALGEKMSLPEEYEQFFAAGTKPADWKGTPPSLDDISSQLSQQKVRIKEYLQGRLDQELPEPFTNKAGISFYTVGESFLFSFYHEALHMENIKKIYRFIKK